MLAVHFPTTDGRELVFRRCTQPDKDQKILLAPLGWELPAQSPPKITSKGERIEDGTRSLLDESLGADEKFPDIPDIPDIRSLVFSPPLRYSLFYH